MTKTTKELNVDRLKTGSVLAIILTCLSYLVADWMGWADLANINFLEFFAVFTSYVCTWLCVFQTRWNYPIGIVTTLAYSILFWQTGLYSVALFNAYLVGSLAYGWFRWGSDENSRPVSFVQGWWHLGYLALAAAIFGLLFSINTLLGNETTWLDAAIAVASGVAQFLLDNKKIETWAVWILVNIASIYLYATSGLYIVAFQYVFFLLNAFYGAYMWNKSMPKDTDGFEDYIAEVKFPDIARFPKDYAKFS